MVKYFKNLLAAAINASWKRNVITGSGRFRKYVFNALVIVFVSHSQRSLKTSLSAFRRSSPKLSNFDTFELTPTSLYKPCSSSPLASNSAMHCWTKLNPTSSKDVSSVFDTLPGCPYVYKAARNTSIRHYKLDISKTLLRRRLCSN